MIAKTLTEINSLALPNVIRVLGGKPDTSHSDFVHRLHTFTDAYTFAGTYTFTDAPTRREKLSQILKNRKNKQLENRQK